MSDKAAPTLLQRAVMWILHAVMFYVVALYPVYLMARFEPDDVVHYGFLRWMAVVLILYWTALQLFFTERPGETRVGRMLLAVTAAGILVIGTFTPMVSLPFIGGIDYFRDGYGDGYILLIMAGLSAALAVTGRWKQVLVPALGSLAAILWTFLGVQDTIAQARSGAAAELTGNPHEGLAASVMASIQWEWGWVLLFAGSGLLVYSAARRDRSEDVSPPLVSVAVEEEPEAAPVETAGEAGTEAEVVAAPEAEVVAAPEAAIPAAEAAADVPDEEVSEAAADTASEPAEAVAEAPPAEPEPVAQPSAEETAAAPPAAPAGAEPAPATDADAEKPTAAAPDTAAEAAPARESEAKPAEAAGEPAPEPAAADAGTAAAPAADHQAEPAAGKPAAAAAAATAAATTATGDKEPATAETAPAPEKSTPAVAGETSTDAPASDAVEPAAGESPEATGTTPDPTPDAAKK